MGNPFDVDISPLFMQARPSALSHGMSQAGDLLSVFMERKRLKEEAKAKAEHEMALKKMYYNNLAAQEKRLSDKDAASARFDQEKLDREQRAKGAKDTYDAYQKSGAEGAGIIAQGYGGQVAPKVAPDSEPVIPLMPMPPGAMEPKQFTPGHVLRMPGSDTDIDLGQRQPQSAHFDRLLEHYNSLPPSPAVEMEKRRVLEARAAQLGGKDTLDYLDKGRAGQRQLDIAAMRKKKGGGTGGTGPLAGMKPSQVADDAARDMNAYLAHQGYKADVNTMKQFQRMESAANEALKGNSSAARVFMGMFTKFAQGESGVLNESDMEVFWNQAGSPQERTEEALAKLVDGGLGAQKQRNALGAIKALMETAKARQEAVYEGAEGFMQKYGAEGDRHLKAYFGKGFKPKPAQLAPADDDRLKGMGF